jgi:hypothetical protein
MNNNNKNPNDYTTRPMGLDLNNFLPNNNNNDNYNNKQKISEDNDKPIIEEISQNSKNFKLIFDSRIKNLSLVNNAWNNGRNKVDAYDCAYSLKDLAVQNDLFNYSLIKTELNRININAGDAISLFPMIMNLISSKYAIYFKNGILSAWKILKYYYEEIINTKQSQFLNQGRIELSKEDKIKKYDILIKYFKDIRRHENVEKNLNGNFEGLELNNFLNELDYFLKKCSGY